MEIGSVLLLIAGFFCFLDIILLILSNRSKRLDRISQGLVVCSVCSIWGSLLVLLKYIFDNNFSYKYVLENSSTNLPMELKLSVLWAGQEGSLLFWTSLIFLFYVVFRRILNEYAGEKLVRRSFITALILCLAFAIITIMSNPFAVTGTTVAQEGRGLNPLLRTFWNIFHPPIVFVGYAATIIPFSIAIARMTEREVPENSYVDRKMNDFLNLQMAFTWTFLTMGIIMGGYWAYVTLGWGGYWAWDPVETSSLIAWLFCTVYFHGRSLLEQRSIGTNTHIFLTYLSVIFATFITRSGVLSSVHGFAESPVTLGFIFLMFGSLFIFIMFLGYQISSSSLSLERIRKRIRGSTLMLALFISLICVIGLTIVCSVGVIYPIILSVTTRSQYGMEPTFFNRFSFPFALGFTISIFFCTFPNPKLRRTLIKIVCFGIGLGLVALFLGFPTNSSLANLLIPITILGLFCIGAGVVKNFLGFSKAGTLLRSSSHSMLHLGLGLILLGVLMSSNMQTSGQGWCSIGNSVDLGSISVELNDIKVEQFTLYSYTVSGKILAFENGGLAGGGYATYSVEFDWGSYSRVLIISNPWRDLYISLRDVTLNPTTGTIQCYLEVKAIKLVSLVWAGSLITLIAISTMLMIYGVGLVKRESGEAFSESSKKLFYP